MDSQTRARINDLQVEIERLRQSAQPEEYCARCLRPLAELEDVGDDPLTDVTVVVADGEEGYANVTQLVCVGCFDALIEKLIDMGFLDHRHGSTSSLEYPRCPGYNHPDKCSSPTHYGNVTWGHRPPQEPEDDG